MAQKQLLDARGRALRELRVSVTDRCNFRCRYCLPRETTKEAAFLPRAELLSFEELARLSRIFVGLGVSKLRLTGGEPLLRKGVPDLVRALARIPSPSPIDLALTTNGVLLGEQAQALRAAGLLRLTVSLDALDEAVFQAMGDAPRFHVRDVLTGIDSALQHGFSPIKINVVVIRGQNDDQIERLARHFSGRPVVLRFIEFMDVGTRNAWEASQVFSASEIEARLARLGPLRRVKESAPVGVAERFVRVDTGDEFGIIASVTRPFCGDCTRARLSADGRLFDCLFAQVGLDLKGPLREGASDDNLAQLIQEFWAMRQARYSELRSAGEASGRRLPLVAQGRIEMSYIGG